MTLALALLGVPADPTWKTWLTWFCRSEDPPVLLLAGLCLAAIALGPLARRPARPAAEPVGGRADRA